MDNNNITAVNFIKEQIELDSDTSFFNIDWDKFDEIIKKAKEMEKEQIERAYKMGRYESDMVVMSDKFYAEHYYNETFKSE